MVWGSRLSKLYAICAHTRAQYRYAASIAVVFGIAAIWYITVFSAFVDTHTAYRLEIADLHKHRALLEQIERNNGLLKKAIASIGEHMRALPHADSQELGENIDFVFHQAAHHGLHVGMCLPHEEQEHEWCTESKIFFDFQGTFDGVKKFFDAIAQHRRMIRCSRLYIEKIGDGMVRILCVMDFYTVHAAQQKGVS